MCMYTKEMKMILLYYCITFLLLGKICVADEVQLLSKSSTGDRIVPDISVSNDMLDIINQQEQLIQVLQMRNHALEVENKELRTVLSTLDIHNLEQNRQDKHQQGTMSHSITDVSYHALRREILRLMTKELFDIPNGSFSPKETMDSDNRPGNNAAEDTVEEEENNVQPGSYAALYRQRYYDMEQEWKQPQYVKITCKENIDVTIRPLTEEEKLDGTGNYDTTDPALRGNECLVLEVQAPPEFSARFVLACDDIGAPSNE